jgi:hypothetical protein
MNRFNTEASSAGKLLEIEELLNQEQATVPTPSK